MIGDILTAVNASLATLVPNVTTPIGEEQPFVVGAPPRVAWVQEPEEIGPAIQATNNAGLNPRPLWTRLATLQAHCWGQDTGGTGGSSRGRTFDITATESLVQSVVQAIHPICFGAYEVLGIEWETEKGAQLKRGKVAVLRVRFLVPIADVTYGTAKVTSEPVTLQVNFPDGTSATNP